MAVGVDVCQIGLFVLTFLKLFLQKIWRFTLKSIPLHPLLRNKLAAYGCLKQLKEEFFEKIYINREVVQEASVWL